MRKGKKTLVLNRVRLGLKALKVALPGLLPAALLLLLSGGTAFAQYKPIPNYVVRGSSSATTSTTISRA
jgi:hypothetical protein